MGREEKERRPRRPHAFRIFTAILVIIVCFTAIVIVYNLNNKDKEVTKIVTASDLEKVLEISELTTYEVTYNGVAYVSNSDAKHIYDVAYNATVNVGFDMQDLEVTVDETNKKFIVNVPKMSILGDPSVDAGSLDYIFVDDKYNTDSVSKDALAACVDNARYGIVSNEMVYDLAADNAKNCIEGLMSPFLEQYPEYTLEINVGEGEADE